MSQQYTAPKLLQCHFNGSVMSFMPKPQYKNDSENCLLKINSLVKTNFQTNKNCQLERQNQSNSCHKNKQIFKFKYQNPPKIQTPIQRNHLNASYYKTLQQTQKNNHHLENSIIQKKHQSQIQKFLVKQNQNLIDHRDFLTTEVRKYRSKAKNYRQKYHQYKQKTKILQQEIQIWKLKFQQMKSYVFNSQAHSIKTYKGLQSTGMYLSNTQTYKNGLKSGSIFGSNQNQLNISKVQINQSRYYLGTQKQSKASDIYDLSDQIKENNYDSNFKKDNNPNHKNTQIAKQMLISEIKKNNLANKKVSPSINQYSTQIIQKNNRFLHDESVCYLQQDIQLDKSGQIRKQLGQITHQQNIFKYSGQSFKGKLNFLKFNDK